VKKQLFVKSADSFADWTRRNTSVAPNQLIINDIPETNFTAFSTSTLSNVSTTSRFEKNQSLQANCFSINRALAMGRSLEETYAFSGVHHIFDHHKGSGIFQSFNDFNIFIWIIFSCTCSIRT
jgi:hypothetical protein